MKTGFNVTFNLLNSPSQEYQNNFWDSFIQEAIENNGLVCGGACGEVWDIFITLDHSGDVTELHQEQVLRWLETHPAIGNITMGELINE